MHKVPGLVLVLLVVLAGCNAPSPSGAQTQTETTEVLATDTGTNGSTAVSSNGPGGQSQSQSQSTGGAERDRTHGSMVESRPDPATDRIGWEAGYWHNETIDVNNADGLNATERQAAVARAMARVEVIRQLEFRGNDTIPTDVISRETHRQNVQNRSATVSKQLRTFDNTKFEALLLIGEDTDSIAVQSGNTASAVLGYYDTENDSIVLVSDTGQPQLAGEQTLAQEVGHALQDRRFNLTELRSSVKTRDELNGQNGLVEGDGNLIDSRYMERCGNEWTCIPNPEASGPAGAGNSGDIHPGVNIMRYFPYSDGPTFIEYYFERGGWERINEMYDDPPTTAEQIIHPERYGSHSPANVSLPESATNGWERVRPSTSTNETTDHTTETADYARLGQSALTSMFAYTALERTYRQRGVVSPRSFINFENGRIDRDGDPFNYEIQHTSGWNGDRMHIYSNPDAGENETAYVWRLAWDSPSDASKFVAGYEQLLEYWGGEQVDDAAGTGTKTGAGTGTNTNTVTWQIPEDSGSPFADAFRIDQDGDTVTIINAPTVDDLSDLAPRADQ